MNLRHAILVIPAILVCCGLLAEESQRPDRAKDLVIEAPLEAFLAETAAPAPQVARPQAVSPEAALRETKIDVELPAKGVIAQTAPAPDDRKRSIEADTKEFVAEFTIPATDSTKPAPSAATSVENPKVAPGKVTWHGDFAAACAASSKSGKPVLFFQMMGNLDDRFC